MVHYEVGKITVEGYVSCSYIKPIIETAVTFLCRNMELEKSCFDFLCIISDDYPKDIQKFHGKPEEKDNSNAMFIPTFYQKESQGRPVLIFNWSKIWDTSNSFITSVFVHEFTHFLDYKLCDELEEKFGRIFMLNVELNTFPDRIGGLHSVRSEMRAKYFQEKYECSLLSRAADIRSRMIRCAVKITAPDDYYNIAHLSGQFLCWQEYSKKFNALSAPVADLNGYLLDIFEKNPYSNYLDVFSKTDFLKKCDDVYREFHS